MRNLYGNNNQSDQEELVENIFATSDENEDEDDDDNDEEEDEEEEDEDNDEDDDDDEQDVFSDRIHIDAETEELISISLVKSSSINKKNDCDNALLQMDRCPNIILREQQQRKQNLDAVRRTKSSFCLLLLFGMGLMVTSALLLVLIPLYQSQFIAESTKNNSHGMLLFVQPLATLFLILTTIICSAVFKWNIRLLKLPTIPGKKLIFISLCFGLASTLFIVGSYKRVACHLQDPLKGTALAFSLLFYFFFCTRLMGLQKIFSATTSVIGLFISVDYGLCDEFHCHGNVISFKEKMSHTGWQGRAFWALIYTFGISLWSLHIALLEGCFVDSNETNSKQTNFLKTISKFVSSHDDQQKILNDALSRDNDLETSTSKKNMHPMHVAMWVHIFGTIFALFFGYVDVFPITGTQIKTFTEHWIESKHTFQCHLNISSSNTVNFDLNSNNTSMQTTIMKSISKSPQQNIDINLVHKGISIHPNRTSRSSPIEANKHQHKISHLNAFLKYKNTTSNHLPSKSGNLKTVGHKNIKVDCSQNSGFYALILICTYVGFVACLFNFLSISQSAVFTVAMATGTLPFTGLFWSFYKLDTRNGLNAAIVWAPSVSGELICSLLGTPIVFLGIVFLFKSHYSDMLKQSHRSSHHKELVT
ncbi:uncharacterized protein LOC129909273 [Episyrphus balteatus]|uniref:uncharacterized protein LOC129909273 n=1 Tax=Episyrphus balteatus TaxID=286459 RepID=UPI00248543F7|nr:uncharacterized protein LOC129909273 [Episyrphus balteatus]